MKPSNLFIILSLFLCVSCLDSTKVEEAPATSYTKNGVMDLDPGLNNCSIGLFKTEDNEIFALAEKPSGFSGNGIKVKITYTIAALKENCGKNGHRSYIQIAKIVAL